MLLAASAAAKKKRKTSVPKLPADLASAEGCPLHKDSAPAGELSEFGRVLEKDGRMPEAERCYALAIKSSPKAGIGWFDLATARQVSDPKLAVRYWRHALRLQPSSEAYAKFGVLLRTSDRQKEAVHAFRAAVRTAPNDADPLFHLGGSLEAAADGQVGSADSLDGVRAVDTWARRFSRDLVGRLESR